MMRKLLIYLVAVTTVSFAIACDGTPSPTLNELHPPHYADGYDPAEGGWTLILANDFSSKLSEDGFEDLIIEGDPVVAIVNGALNYAGDSLPDDKMWLRTPYGFTNNASKYKMYVEPGGPLADIDNQHIAFHLWSDSTEGKIETDLRANEIFLAAWADGPADDQWDVVFPAGLVVDDTAFELIIDGATLTSRLVDLKTGDVVISVTGTLGDLAYYRDHDIRLRCAYTGTITLDDFRIYRK